MGKILKNNVKILVAFIIGLIISGVTVYAVTLIDSKEVSFTPENDSWNVSNVSEAMDELYEMNEFVKTISSTECVSGTFICDSNCTGSSGKVVMSGFTPNEFIMVELEDTYMYYNKEVDSSYVYYAYPNSPIVGVKYLLSQFWSFDNNMVTVHDWGNFHHNKTVYYIACK